MSQTSSVAIADPRAALFRRIGGAALVLSLVVMGGTCGYFYLGQGRWGWGECFYMTVITLWTVGYGETLEGFADVEHARAFTVMLIVLGSGTLAYSVSTLTAFILEGDLRGALQRNRMQKRIDTLENHIVVCGAGATGSNVVRELISTKTAFVAIDLEEERLIHLREEVETDFPYVIGDATDDISLERAGVARSRGVVAALHDDKDNLFVTVSARALSPTARIIAKAVEPTAGAKLKRAGADSIVSPNMIGGMRMVSEMIRPSVVEFLDLMLRDKKKNLRIEQVEVPIGCRIAGSALKDTEIRQATAGLILGIREADGTIRFNPGPNDVVNGGSTLIVMGETDDIIRLRQEIASGKIGRRSLPT